MKMLDSIVIGGGVTGLTCAFELTRQGREVLLLESSTIGGLIRTEEKEGFTLECGPNVFLSKRPLMELLDTLGLSEDVIYPVHRIFRQHVWYQGRPERVPKDPISFCKSPLFAREWKTRVLKNVLFGPVPAVEAEDTNIADFFRPFMGDHAVSALLAPALKGVYGGIAGVLSARTVFPGMWEAGKKGMLFRQYLRQRVKNGRAKVFTIKGGMRTLTSRLADACNERQIVRSGSVVQVQRSREGFEITLQDGEILNARNVFICTSGPSSAGFLTSILPDLSAQLRRVSYVPLIVAHVQVPGDAPMLKKSFGILFPAEPGRRILGVMFNSLLFPHVAPEGRHLCTVMLGGSEGHSALELREEQIREIVTRELDESLGIIPGNFLAITRWIRAIPEYFVGHHRIVRLMKDAEYEFRGLHFVGTDLGLPGVADRVDIALQAARSMS